MSSCHSGRTDYEYRKIHIETRKPRSEIAGIRKRIELMNQKDSIIDEIVELDGFVFALN